MVVRTPSDSLVVSYNWWIRNGNPALDFGPQGRRTYRDLQTGGLGQPFGDRNMYHYLRNGEIDYDQTRVAHLSSRVQGTVWRVEEELGHAVKQGDVLALVDAAEVGRAKTEILQAAAQVDVKEKTFERGDAITVLGHLFGGAGPLRAPSGACGPDPTPDALGCESYPPCESFASP